MIHVRHLTLLLAVCSFVGSGCSQEEGRRPANRHRSADGYLDAIKQSPHLIHVLIEAADRYKVSIVAEIVQPFPTNLVIPEADDVYSFLNAALAPYPEYGWTRRGAAIWVFHRKLAGAEKSFLNMRVKRFQLRDSFGEMRISIPDAIRAAESGGANLGSVASGGASEFWKSIKLRDELLEDVLVRDILFRLADQLEGTPHRLCSIFQFPTDFPKTKTDRDYAVRTWVYSTCQEISDGANVYVSRDPAKEK